MVAAWSADAAEDCLWLVYSANYLLRTAGIHWAIDPLQLRHRLPSAEAVDVHGLRKLSLVVLTHRHQDHLDIDLLRALRTADIRWVVLEDLAPMLVEAAGISPEQMIIPQPLSPIDLGGLVLTPFEGLHWEKPSAGTNVSARGVPSMAYLAEFNGRRWLFPGDVRMYDPSLLPHFEDASALDGVFAHLWLGRSQALADDPPLLEDFCRFFSELKPRQIVISHLHEFGRSAEDFWDRQHYEKAAARLGELAPQILVRLALMGESVSL